jgi:hypothetical protein
MRTKNQVSYDSSITIREFMLDYLIKNNLDTKDYSFKLGGKILNSNRFIDRKLDQVIQEGKEIQLYRKHDILGSPTIRHYESSHYLTKEYQPGFSNLSFRSVCNGLNIQTKCKEKCAAYGVIIYIKIGYVEDWYLGSDKQICPFCKNKVEAINYWFKDCKYIIHFLGQEGERSIEGIADSSGKFQTFNENDYFWCLKFTVKKL